MREGRWVEELAQLLAIPEPIYGFLPPTLGRR